MRKVKTLREDVYKKIAAGEVVERPLSVVKELVENAIDAGADSISVEIQEGGKRLIKVSDNGSGFDPDDIEIAFQNHSTSKITEISDFNTLNTLGFRGEALPSIREVSKIEIRTSDNTDGKGVSCIIEDGKIGEREEIACNRGTTIVVKELFYNFPVRKKFLKTDRTELDQVISFLEPAALVQYDKTFELIHNNKTVFLYKKTTSLKDRIYQVFGMDFLEELQEIDFSYGQYHVTGFISGLNRGISVKKHQYFFVNRRPVREKTLVAALNNTFQKFIEKSKNPAAILLFDIPPHEVDVNIHPMKLEIKFENASSIYQFIKLAIEESFGVSENFQGTRPTGEYPGSYGSPFPMNESPVTPAASSSSPWASPSYRPYPPFSASEKDNRQQNPLAAHYRYGNGPASPQAAPSTGVNENERDMAQTALFPGKFPDQEEFSIIGQYKNSFILVEKDGNLLIVDQHNAQERINFDLLKKEYLAEKVVSITPLFPVIIELTPSEAVKLDTTKKNLLEKIGFRIEPLSGNSHDIKSFPGILGERNIKDALRTVILMDANADKQEKEGSIDFEDSILAEIACKSAIKVNHKLYPDQMITIVKNLFKTGNPYFCPHQRPIIIEFSLEQIEKLLKRK